MHISAPSLFKTVPPDHFKFFDIGGNGRPNFKKVTTALNYGKKDIAQAANLPLSSIRYDQKMPSELIERIIEWAIALNLVADFFKDEQKTILWFSMPNPLLGGLKPRDMIRMGRFKKLFKFIQTALDENNP